MLGLRAILSPVARYVFAYVWDVLMPFALYSLQWGTGFIMLDNRWLWDSCSGWWSTIVSIGHVPGNILLTNRADLLVMLLVPRGIYSRCCDERPQDDDGSYVCTP